MTVSQPGLFDRPAPAEKPLTERQEFALETLRNAGSAGLTADEVGAAWHHRQGKHDLEAICEWCGKTGNELLRALRKRKHVKQRRDGTGTWVALEGLVEPTVEVAPPPAQLFTRPDGTKGDIPF